MKRNWFILGWIQNDEEYRSVMDDIMRMKGTVLSGEEKEMLLFMEGAVAEYEARNFRWEWQIATSFIRQCWVSFLCRLHNAFSFGREKKNCNEYQEAASDTRLDQE